MIWEASVRGEIPVGPTFSLNRRGELITALPEDATDWIRRQIEFSTHDQILIPVIRDWQSDGVLHATFLMLKPTDATTRRTWSVRNIDPIPTSHSPYPKSFRKHVQKALTSHLSEGYSIKWKEGSLVPSGLPETAVVRHGIEFLMQNPPEGEQAYVMWCAALSSLITGTMVKTGHYQYQVNYALASMEREDFMKALWNYVEDSVHLFKTHQIRNQGEAPHGDEDYRKL